MCGNRGDRSPQRPYIPRSRFPFSAGYVVSNMPFKRVVVPSSQLESTVSKGTKALDIRKGGRHANI